MEIALYIEGNIHHPIMGKVEEALDANVTVGAYYSERKELIAEYGGMPPSFFFDQNSDIISTVRRKELESTDVMLVVGDCQTVTSEIHQAIDDGIPLVIFNDTAMEVLPELKPYVLGVVFSLSDLESLDFETC